MSITFDVSRKNTICVGGEGLNASKCLDLTHLTDVYVGKKSLR